MPHCNSLQTTSAALGLNVNHKQFSTGPRHGSPHVLSSGSSLPPAGQILEKTHKNWEFPKPSGSEMPMPYITS